VDATSGETITYNYDALKRLIQATGAGWGDKYVYDGWGNMTQMNPTAGNPPSLNVTADPTTNRLTVTGASYNANGSLTAAAGVGYQYDAANRLQTVQKNGNYNYAYDAQNLRAYFCNASGSETIYFYGIDGKKLATYTYSITGSSGNYAIQLTQQSQNVYFAGRLISAEGNPVSTDRLASVRSGGPNGLGYQAQYPYGMEYTTTANDREKYATYTRDSVSGMDYAMNRYYSSTWGRFLTPDVQTRSSSVGNPQSWNRYSYAGGDPANQIDPLGLYRISPADPDGPGFPGDPGSGCDGLPEPYGWLDPGFPLGPMPLDPISGLGCPQNFMPPWMGLGGGSGGAGGGNGLGAFLQSAAKKTCSGLPDGMLLSASGGVSAGIGIAAGGDIVFNFNTGQISLFGFVNFQAAGAPSAGATAQGGFIWGLGNSNQNYAGPFTTIGVGVGAIGATLAGSSQGISNPFNLNTPITATAGAQTPGASFAYGVASYTNPVNVGSLNSVLGVLLFPEEFAYMKVFQLVNGAACAKGQ
jgi:RHS repeat-associated protein